MCYDFSYAILSALLLSRWVYFKIDRFPFSPNNHNIPPLKAREILGVEQVLLFWMWLLVYVHVS